MWGLILAGAVIVAIAIIVEVSYSYSLLKPVPYAFSFTPGMMDYVGLTLGIIGLALIMVGGLFKHE